MYFDQLLGAAGRNTFFSAVFKLFCSFQTFFSNFTPEITKKHVNLKKVFPSLSARNGEKRRKCAKKRKNTRLNTEKYDFDHPTVALHAVCWSKYTTFGRFE